MSRQQSLRLPIERMSDTSHGVRFFKLRNHHRRFCIISLSPVTIAIPMANERPTLKKLCAFFIFLLKTDFLLKAWTSATPQSNQENHHHQPIPKTSKDQMSELPCRLPIFTQLALSFLTDHMPMRLEVPSSDTSSGVSVVLVPFGSSTVLAIFLLAGDLEAQNLLTKFE